MGKLVGSDSWKLVGYHLGLCQYVPSNNRGWVGHVRVGGGVIAVVVDSVDVDALDVAVGIGKGSSRNKGTNGLDSEGRHFLRMVQRGCRKSGRWKGFDLQSMKVGGVQKMNVNEKKTLEMYKKRM